MRHATEEGASSAPAYHLSTRCATVDDPPHRDQYGASSVPVYMTATFKGPPGAEFDYTRSGNPSRTVLQNHLSSVQRCKHSFAVSTGMSCLDVITRLVRPGEVIVAGDDLYGGTNRLLGLLQSQYNIKVDHVDTTDSVGLSRHLAARAAAAADSGAGISMVMLESPTNPLIKICDIAQSVRAVRRHAPNAVVVVDNTMLSPYLMRPLALGADIVYDSGTKYLSGHHDIMAGVIACDRDDLAQRMHFTINSIGCGLAPMDCFMLLRGVKTLALRMDRQQASAMQIASFLDALGFRVNYPGLRSHPGHQVHVRQASGAGGVLSFETGSKALSERVTHATRLWGVSVSFGCVNSLISMPCLMSHASIDPKVRAERGLPENLIRLCVGIEDVRDLLADLEQALLVAGAIRRRAGLAADAMGAAAFERVPVDDEMDALRAHLRAASARAAPDGPPAALTVSAPGKVILFGEHAVVHGVTAIAAATSLRCYGRVTPRGDSRLSLHLPDIDLHAEWARDSLPWHVQSAPLASPPSQLDAALVDALQALITPQYAPGDRRHAACVAFLYLYMSIIGTGDAAQTYLLRSSLPIGAGLGSSAAVSVCLAALMLYTHGTLPMPHTSDAQLPPAQTEAVNGWAFLAEKVIHGDPSGVDNTVATYGGATAFTRALPTNALTENRMVPMRGFDALRLLITDTRVPRDTKALVASVGAQKRAEPERIAAVFETIQLLAEEAASLLGSASGDRAALLARLGRIIDINHLQLTQLRVGHAALEQVRAICGAPPHGLHTKLTGAGGGGCAITLVDDDVAAAQMDALLRTLSEHGFSTCETEVGGPGLGVVAAAHDDPVAELAHVSAIELAAWAQATGTWVYA
ncbi:cysteine-S-conjugate beta-lyase [Malassezia sp. CBS 17886]|nr:cysteine-S-conjugate beta-lyase [Malassezia sp. CBS 17886]